MRRAAPVLVALGIAALLISYVAYTQRVVRELRRDTMRSAEMSGRIYGALSDTTAEAGRSAMLDLARLIGERGVPAIVTDASGTVTATQNLPFDPAREPERIAPYIAELDRQNPPVVTAGMGTVHFGHTPVVRSLRIIPMLQALVLGIALVAGVAMLRARGRADRERMWAGMARESAHQLGTPLSSLNGWIELLSEEAGGTAAMALPHMRADLERLDRVARRFERIGRPPRTEPVDIAALAERVAGYFRARVPTLAHTVTIHFERRGEPVIVEGDPVLLEWALESLIKNAVDALAGRGGVITVAAEPAPESGACVRVSDDGPGIPREMQRRVFSAGFTTKEGGWGIGLSLARRIVEQTHGGKLNLVPSSGPGATFEIILR